MHIVAAATYGICQLGFTTFSRYDRAPIHSIHLRGEAGYLGGGPALADERGDRLTARDDRHDRAELAERVHPCRGRKVALSCCI